jgi:hypothetical protein
MCEQARYWADDCPSCCNSQLFGLFREVFLEELGRWRLSVK